MEIIPSAEVKAFEKVRLGSVFQATVRKHTRWCIRAQAGDNFHDAIAAILSPVDRSGDPGAAWVEAPDEFDCVLDYGNEWICRPSFEADDVLIGQGVSLSTAGSLVLNSKGAGIALRNWGGQIPLVLDLDANIVTRSASSSRTVIVKRWDILLRPTIDQEPIHLVTVTASGSSVG